MKNQKTLTGRREASRLLKLTMLSDVQCGDTEGTRSSGISVLKYRRVVKKKKPDGSLYLTNALCYSCATGWFGWEMFVRRVD